MDKDNTETEVEQISSIISSLKPAFAGSDIDQETLHKLEQLWIKKLKLLEEEEDLNQQDDDKEEDLTDGLVSAEDHGI